MLLVSVSLLDRINILYVKGKEWNHNIFNSSSFNNTRINMKHVQTG
jgi:hypothetical protein